MTPKRKKQHSTSLAMIRRYFPLVAIVKDATHTMLVEVTSADNANADVKNHRTCALAIAATRCFHADGAIIGMTTSWLIKGRTAFRFMNAETVTREITSFDRKAGFDAGTYLLSPPSDSNRLGMVRSHNPDRRSNGSRKGKPAFRHYTRNVRASLRGNITLSPV
jgi:hypothetical protein